MCFNFFKKNKNVEPAIERHVEPQAQPEAPSDYSYQLRVEDETDSGLSRTLFDPSDDALDEAVDILKLCENSFLVLESRNPISDCTFIQATGYEHGEKTVYSEIQHIEVKNGKEVLSNYSKVMNIEEFKRVLKSFAHMSAPSLYNWEHVMDFDRE